MGFPSYLSVTISSLIPLWSDKMLRIPVPSHLVRWDLWPNILVNSSLDSKAVHLWEECNFLHSWRVLIMKGCNVHTQTRCRGTFQLFLLIQDTAMLKWELK